MLTKLIFSLFILFSTCVCIDAEQNCTFQTLRNVTVSGNSLTKTSANGFDAGARSVFQFTGDFWVEYTVAETGKDILFGLASTDPDGGYASINYAAYETGANKYNVYESNTQKATNLADITVGSVIRVERVGSTVYYKHNGSTVYTSLVASSGTLFMDICIYNASTTISGIKVGGFGSPGAY